MQFEFAGALAAPDGRYLARSDGEQQVLVVETLGAPSPPRRRRRRPKESEAAADPAPLPLSRVTAVRAEEPFEQAGEADDNIQAKGQEDVGAGVGERIEIGVVPIQDRQEQQSQEEEHPA